MAAPQEQWVGRVRRALAAEAARVRPSRTDLAGRAIAQARRARRRYRLASLAAVVVATTVVAGALVQWLPGQRDGQVTSTGLFSDAAIVTPAPSPSEPPRLADGAVVALAATDVIGPGHTGGLVLATADGRTEPLGPVRMVSAAYRIGAGWAVVGGEAGTVRLWWVQPAAEPVALLSGMDAITVDHGRVAWRRGSMLSTAVLSGAGALEYRLDTRAPEGGGSPVGFLGEAVLLRRTEHDGGTAWDLWVPARGGYRPGWTREVVRIYGAEPGGATAVGLAEESSGRPCLARLSVADSLAVTARVCPEGLPVLAAATVSPDGRWLVGTAEVGGSGRAAGDAGDDRAGRVVVVDLPAAFAGDPGSVAPADGVAPARSRPVWSGADQVVLATADAVVRVDPGRVFTGAPDAVAEVILAGDPPVLVHRPVG